MELNDWTLNENATVWKTMENMIRPIVCASHKTVINSTPLHILNHVLLNVKRTHDKTKLEKTLNEHNLDIAFIFCNENNNEKKTFDTKFSFSLHLLFNFSSKMLNACEYLRRRVRYAPIMPNVKWCARSFGALKLIKNSTKKMLEKMQWKKLANGKKWSNKKKNKGKTNYKVREKLHTKLLTSEICTGQRIDNRIRFLFCFVVNFTSLFKCVGIDVQTVCIVCNLDIK